MGSHLTEEQRRQIRRLCKEGMPLQKVANEIGCHLSTVVLHARRKDRPDTAAWSPKGRLKLSDREEISRGLARGESYTEIARSVGRCVSSVSREVAKNGGRYRYRATGAQLRAYKCARRPKDLKLEDPRLKKVVTEYLESWWSPQQVASRLLIDFPDDPMMRVSHETIYKSIYVQGRGELKRELYRCLRSGRFERKPRSGVKSTRGRIPDMVMISDRPGDADDRKVPGHWEGDLIIGKDHASAVGTLVERSTGYLMLLHLPDGKTAEDVNLSMKKQVSKLPDALKKTITWDQGSEMYKHAAFTVDTGIQVYFCDPHSPWQRPSNENTNGLLRQYMPKGTDLSKFSEADLEAIAESLNGRPRKRLGFMKPSERFAELLALTG
jgi:IS30 family transposase